MKLLYWLLPLALLLFAMPVLADDIGPLGDVVIEQGMDMDLLPTPDQVIEREIFPFGISSGLVTSGSEDINLCSEKPVNTTAAQDNYADLRARPLTLMTVLFTSEAVHAVAPRLWQPEGGVAHSHCTHPGHQHPLTT